MTLDETLARAHSLGFSLAAAWEAHEVCGVSFVVRKNPSILCYARAPTLAEAAAKALAAITIRAAATPSQPLLRRI